MPGRPRAATGPEIEGDVARYARTRDPRLRGEIVTRYRPLIESLAGKFAGRGVAVEDLVQVGSIGLVQALDRFDPERGVRFSTYAINTIVGKIKHHFRDCTWMVRVPRRLQERSAAVHRAKEELTRRNGAAPTLPELARHLRLTEEQIVEAMEMGHLYRPVSLDTQRLREESPTDQRLTDLLGEEDPRLAAVVEHASLRQALGALEPRKRWILRRRYFDDWSQSEVGEALGISQMHVSRLEREALGELRAGLGGEG